MGAPLPTAERLQAEAASDPSSAVINARAAGKVYQSGQQLAGRPVRLLHHGVADLPGETTVSVVPGRAERNLS
jgi:hypothetical protein